MGAAVEADESFFGGRDDLDLDTLLAGGAGASAEIASFSLNVPQQSTVVEGYGTRDAGHQIEDRMQSSEAFWYRFDTFAESS